MRLFTPLRPNASAPLARANPVAKLAAALLVFVVLFLSVDPLTPLVVLAGLLAAVPFTGLGWRALLGRTWPILLAAGMVAVFNGIAAGAASGLALGLRVLALAFSGVLAIATTDPTDLTDALIQQLRLSPRFAVGALAAVRLLPVLALEWQTISLARRARGVAAGRNPLVAGQLAFGKLMTLLVGAIRRATRLATAMEARGFGAAECRSVARPRRMTAGDWWLIAAAATLGLAAIGISLALGAWEFLFA
ncbi:MAG TPA: energy-coupling factor transporter transmembrane component T [Candidatus Limnocylindria bacterium]|nr:energy-coupling factor transporter transmembrane component T [Candidatus Limnocylindria bacterium]